MQHQVRDKRMYQVLHIHPLSHGGRGLRRLTAGRTTSVGVERGPSLIAMAIPKAWRGPEVPAQPRKTWPPYRTSQTRIVLRNHQVSVGSLVLI
jgi:hypothetical protein